MVVRRPHAIPGRYSDHAVKQWSDGMRPSGSSSPAKLVADLDAPRVLS
jgi:hypothetical protein